MRLKVHIFLLLVSGSALISAQQMSDVSLFQQNQTYYNPAANGNQDVLAANFFYRQKWVGVPGALSTQVFSVHAPLKNPKVAVGVLIENDALGGTGYTGAHFSYAYRLSIGENKLSFGLRAGITNGSQDELSSRDESYDPALEDNMRFWVPNFGFGMLYYGKNFWAGISLPRIFGYESNEAGTYFMKFDLYRHEYFLAGGSSHKINSSFGIEPSLLFIYSPSLTSVGGEEYKPRFAINALAVYKDFYKAGLGFRSGDAIILLLEVNINRQFALGYSYDLGIGGFSDYFSGSHEINIQYKFGYKVNASNPRGF